MLTLHYADFVIFFYPIGNTPAVSLTQNLPPEKPADILLLGSGDVRHILFTAHTDCRPLNITCCDVEKAVIARNVLLLSLFMDEVNREKIASYWNLYYHFRVDQASLRLLQTQAHKLYCLSTSLQAWHASRYGKLIRVCDHGSLSKLREMWGFYRAQREGSELSRFEMRHKAGIQKSIQNQARNELGTNLRGRRSSFPAQKYSAADVDALIEHYWKYGSVDHGQPKLGLTTHANPMFMSPDENVVLHHMTHPLLGFHLAIPYVPLTSGSPLRRPSSGLSTQENVVEAAKTEFYTWALSFRKHAYSITLRVFIGDALAFCHTLKHRNDDRSSVFAHWYRDRFHFEPLMLDEEEEADRHGAPLAFTVIDTSNLIDFVGALNLLVATAPLLAHDLSATLYTEISVPPDSTYSSLFEDLLCGPLSTVSMLLGLVPMDFVTNTSAHSIDHDVLDIAIGSSRIGLDKRVDLFTRVAWKRPLCMHDSRTPRGISAQIHADPPSLATVLYHIYLKMFETEDLTTIMSKLAIPDSSYKSSVPMYQRAAFASLINAFKVRVKADWETTIETFLGYLENSLSQSLIKNHLQELYVWLHLLDIHSAEILKSPPNQPVSAVKTKDLRDWANSPSVVCVTLEVPRERLKVFTDGNVFNIAKPRVRCLIQGLSDGKLQEDIFGALQTGFGKVNHRGSYFSDSFEVDVIEDGSGWGGTSPLIVSFCAPASTVLSQSQTASVRFGIQPTPSSIRAFIGYLGIDLIVYETTLSDLEHVHVSRSPPKQAAALSICDSSGRGSLPPEVGEPIEDTIISVTIDSDTAKVASVTGRINMLSPRLGAVLQTGGPIGSTAETPFTSVVELQAGLKITINFPIAVQGSSLQTRISHRSSHIELVCQAIDGVDWPAIHSFMYPVLLSSESVVVWNMPYLNLQSLPIVDTSNPERLDWLTKSVYMMTSMRERSLVRFSTVEGSVRMSVLPQASTEERSRIEFKHFLPGLFTHFSGVKERTRILGYSSSLGDGVQIFFFVSCLRLDLSNRMVVLDAAVLPLHNTIMPRIAYFLLALKPICEIVATEAAIRVWRQVLPALVERCRTWSHRPDCEYFTKRRIPLSIKRGKRILCSCGEGKLPANFITGVPNWEQAAPYAVRVAISPCFSAAMFETEHITGQHVDEGFDSEENTCRICRKDKRSDGSTLLNCARCHRVRYCSKECQRADWKTHKVVCKTG